MQPWNTNGLVQAPQFNKDIGRSTMKENYQIGVVGNFYKEWKPMVFDKNGGKNKDNYSSVKVDKCKRQFRMFNEQNVNELLN